MNSDVYSPNAGIAPAEVENIARAQKMIDQHLDECLGLAQQLEARLSDILRPQPTIVAETMRKDERVPMSPFQSDLRSKDYKLRDAIETLSRIHNRLDL